MKLINWEFENNTTISRTKKIKKLWKQNKQTNIRICNNKEDYRYTKNNWFQIIFNLIDDSNNIWNFDDENTMENILKKIKKELNTKELNTENTMNKLEALKYLCETTQRSIGGMEFFYLQQDIILENKEIYLKEDIDILIRKVESKIY